MGKFQTFLVYYKKAALILLNICVFVILLNVCFWGIYSVKDKFFKKAPIEQKYGIALFKKVYPDLSEKTIHELLLETWFIPQVYESFTQFKEIPIQGKYINIDENGFRFSKDQAPWPPDPNRFTIFLFGGSTAFGYGVRDHETVASYLQDILASRLKTGISIYNFGRGYYYSTQERIFFERLLSSGFIPNMAIFLDGVNDFFNHTNKPACTDRLERYMKKPRVQQMVLNKMPMTRAIRDFKRMLRNYTLSSGHKSQRKQVFDEQRYNDQKIIRRVVNTYVENKKIIEAVASVYGVRTIFVWQPISIYNYDLKYHLFLGGAFRAQGYSKYGYTFMSDFIKENSLGDNFLWCADIQKDLKESLYVDGVHYSAKMSKILANTIVDLLFKRNLLKLHIDQAVGQQL
ncbi:hypothetical protein ACFL6B_00125 [Thermodesulfobacteriota bacterium]